MEKRRFGPYISLVQMFAIGVLLIISILLLPLIFYMLTQSNDFIGTITSIAIFSVPVFTILSFITGECKTYILDEDGIKTGNLITRSGRTIFYRNIISVESKFFEYPANWFYHRDFKITIKHRSGKLDIFIPGGKYLVKSDTLIPGTTKPNDHAEFLKILGEKIGKAKIKYS